MTSSRWSPRNRWFVVTRALPKAASIMLVAVWALGCDIFLSLEDYRPIAVAGFDLNVTLESDVAWVELDGRRSFVAGLADTRPDRYAWTIVSSPPSSGRRAAAQIETPTASRTDMEVRESGLYVVRLQVYYQGTLGSPDYLSVLVNTGEPGPMLPVADPGPDQVAVADALVTLDGSRSYAPGGGALQYLWSQVFGPNVSLDGGDSATATFTAPDVLGPLRFRLVVTDEDGVSSQPASVEVEVIGEPPPEIEISPDVADFGSIWSGTKSDTRSLQISNPAEGVSHVLSVSIGGEHADQFELADDKCDGRTLGPGDECWVKLRFLPRGESGDRTASLQVDADTGAGVQAMLSGRAEAWMDTEWGRRTPIRIHASEVPGSSCLENFPLLIKLNHADLIDHTHEDGHDLRFTADDGMSVLPHEIEQWSSQGGDLVVWVSVPCLSPVEDTFIFMYYDNPDAEPLGLGEAVWDTGFAAVWHLSTDPDALSSLHDSSSGRNRLYSSRALEWRSPNGLVVGGLVTRDGIGSPSFDNLGGELHYSASHVHGVAAHYSSADARRGWKTFARWSNNRSVSGLLAVFDVPDAELVQHAISPNVGGTAVLPAAPTPGNLLVAMSGHRRSGTAPSAAGWNLVHAELTEISNTSHRRGIALFSKIAEEDEPSSVTVNWSGTTDRWVIVQEFESSIEDLSTRLPAAAIGSSSGRSTASSLAIPPTALQGTTAVITRGVAFPGGDWGEYLRAQSSPGLDITGSEFTLEAWLHAGSGGWAADGDLGIISKVHGDAVEEERYHLGVSWDGFVNVRRYSDGQLIRFDAEGHQVPEDRWVHLAARYDGVQLTAWMDGALIGETAATGPLDPSDRELRVGARTDHRRFSGRIEEVRISRVARSGPWIAASYRNQSSPQDFMTVEDPEFIR